MKPLEGIYQTATKVKVLSSEITNVEEADSFHLLEGCISCTAIARCGLLFRGLRPWYGTERKLLEPGRPAQFLPKQIPGNDPKRRGFRDDCAGVGGNDPKRRGFRDDCAGVGLIHSRGVAGVMPCEEKIHSKGLALICKGKGKHVLTTELEDTCKQN